MDSLLSLLLVNRGTLLALWKDLIKRKFGSDPLGTGAAAPSGMRSACPVRYVSSVAGMIAYSEKAEESLRFELKEGSDSSE